MSIADLRSELCAYLNRTSTDLIVEGVDLVIQAANKAKVRAQRLLDFELLRKSLRVVVPAGSSVDITSGTFTPHDGSEERTYRINRIERAFLQQSADTAAGNETRSGALRPIDYRLRSEIAKREQRFYDERVAWAILSDADDFTINTNFTVLVRQGDKVWLWPRQTTDVTVVIDCVVWAEHYPALSETLTVSNNDQVGFGPIPDTENDYSFVQVGQVNQAAFFTATAPEYANAFLWFNTEIDRWVITSHLDLDQGYWQLTEKGVHALRGHFDWEAAGPNSEVAFGGGPTLSDWEVVDAADDFFLDECYDWLLASCMRSLNYFSKQDERTLITQKAVDEAWAGVVSWNNSIADGGGAQEYDLD
jgi:hypothetical protein